MRLKAPFGLFIIGLMLTTLAAAKPAVKIVSIPNGAFKPLFGPGSEKEAPAKKVSAFKIDRYPISKSDYLQFLKTNSNWAKKNTDELMADENYLLDLSENSKKNSPMTYVSWFAASAYCESKKGRLPTTLEWEYIAAADETTPNALDNDAFINKILSWYAKKDSQKTQDVTTGVPNYYGVQNLLSLNWEWTSDFNSFFLTGDNRQDGDSNNGMFCGSGSLGASNKKDYAAFMRYALRSSLKANYSQKNVGFRCAYD